MNNRIAVGLAVSLAMLEALCACEGNSKNLPAGGPFVNERQFPANGNAKCYYWVDVVTQGGGDVTFTGDRPCNLPDPAFATRGGETNRVILLTGKPYTVNAASKVSVVGRSSPEVRVLVQDDRTIRVQRPLVIGVRDIAK